MLGPSQPGGEEPGVPRGGLGHPTVGLGLRHAVAQIVTPLCRARRIWGVWPRLSGRSGAAAASTAPMVQAVSPGWSSQEANAALQVALHWYMVFEVKEVETRWA